MRFFTDRKDKSIVTTTPALAVNTCPADAKSFELQGRSLVLNQQIYQIYAAIDPSTTGVTVTFSNGLLTVSGTAITTVTIKFLDNNDLVANHKYYFNAPTGSSSSGYRPYFSTSGNSYTTDSIITWTTGQGSYNIRINTGTSANFSFYPQFIDLTQTFGAGFEPTTVAQLKAIIDVDKYIPYNPGTFIHNNATYEVNKWNQLMQPNGYLSRTSTGITYVNNNDGTVTMSGTATGTDNITYLNISSYWIAGHKYLIGTSSKYSNKLSGNSISQDFTGAALFTYSSAAVFLGINVTSGVSYSDTWSVNFIDLTDIFGAGKEPSTVDECKLRFLSMGIDITKYQPYSPLGGQYCGYRNIWDEEWEVGDFNATTGVKESGSRIINADYIPVLSNTNYYVNNTNVITVYYYDSNKNFLGYNNPSSGCFESLPNSAYINFRCSTIYGTTYKNDISIYQVSNKVDLGFNIWDEECELGTIEQDGTMASSTTAIRTKNYIPALAQTVYYINTGKWRDIHCYNSSFQHLGTVQYSASGSGYTFTTLTGTAYLKVPFNTSYGTTYNHDICINLSQPDTTKSPHNGDYRPYLMLRGIGSDFNVWDEQWELGTINATTGELTDSTTMIRSKNKLPVLPSTSYYFQIPSASSTVVAIHAYDTNGTWIGMYQPGGGWITSGGAYNLTTQTFTTPSSAAFLRFRLGTSYGTTYKNDICINLSQPQTTINPHNGQYVPHLFDTYDSMSGILTRRIGAVDLGTLTYEAPSQQHLFFTKNVISTLLKSTMYTLVVDSRIVDNATADQYLSNMQMACRYGTKDRVYFKNESYSDASTFKSAMNGVMLLYELATPQEISTITQPISFVAGKLGKQYGVVDLRSLDWAYSSSRFNYNYVLPGSAIPVSNTTPFDGYCARYIIDAANYGVNGEIVMNNQGYLRIYDNKFTNATAFKNSLQGQYLIYKLADSATNPTYATAGNLIQKTNGDVGDVDFTLKYTGDALYIVTGNGLLLSVED